MRVALIVLTLLLVACAPEPRRELVLDAQPTAGAAAAVAVPSWPAAPAQARYAWVGELTGATNFRATDAAAPGAATRALRWLAGLGNEDQRDALHLVRPQAGMVDAAGRILVTDVGRAAVFVFDGARGRLDVWTERLAHHSLRAPIGIANGAEGTVLVSDAELARVVVFDTNGQALREFGTGQLQRPTGLARDAVRGRVYVADSAAHDIKVFDDAGTLLATLGKRGVAPGEFNGPTHLALVADSLYVSDTLNARIQVLDVDGKPQRAFGERGLYLGNLNRPKGVACDGAGHVYVVESYYDHLLVFDHEGRFLLPIGGSGAGSGQFFLPAGVWTDARGRVFVADMYNQRVAVFDFLGG